jgi:hypothetical protein
MQSEYVTTESPLEAVQDLPEIFDCIIFVSYRNGRPWSARQNIWQRLNPRATDQLRRDSDDQSGCISAFFKRRQRVCAVAIVQGTASLSNVARCHPTAHPGSVRRDHCIAGDRRKVAGIGYFQEVRLLAELSGELLDRKVVVAEFRGNLHIVSPGKDPAC